MASNKSTKANRINIKEPVFALLLTDDASGTTYGEVESLGAAMQVQLTPTLASGILHGDGKQQENISKLMAIAMAIDVNKAPIEARAKILGHAYKNGIMSESAGDEAPYIAVGYKVEQTNRKCELIWLLKGRAHEMNSTVQQSTDNLNFSTDSITINFLPRNSDDKLRFFADSANADLTDKQIKDWFMTGPKTEPMPGV